MWSAIVTGRVQRQRDSTRGIENERLLLRKSGDGWVVSFILALVTFQSLVNVYNSSVLACNLKKLMYPILPPPQY